MGCKIHKTPRFWCGSCFAALRAQLREAQEELAAWHQEFTVIVNGKLYTMDALEAGKMVQDAKAEARMARQDWDAAIERGATAINYFQDWIEVLRIWGKVGYDGAKEQRAQLAEHHRDSTGMWKECPICGARLNPAAVLSDAGEGGLPPEGDDAK